MRAALHLHSTYSDGEFSLAELRDTFLAAGCQLIAVTDHAESFDREKLARYTAECAELSDERIVLVPGLEFACRQNMHILGYGVIQRIASDQPADVLRHIADQGGVSVIAHPKNEFFDWIRTFDVLPNGIEVWNSKYDGRHAPRPETFRLVSELRARKPDLHGFYGIDLHWRNQFRALHVQLQGAMPADPGNPLLLARSHLMETLRAGRFAGLHGALELPSDAQLSEQMLRDFGVRHSRSRRFKSALMRAKRIADALGARAPDRLKAQLRRWF